MNCAAELAWDPEAAVPFMIIKAERLIETGEEASRATSERASERVVLRRVCAQIIIDYGDNFWRVIMRYTMKDHEEYTRRVRAPTCPTVSHVRRPRPPAARAQTERVCGALTSIIRGECSAVLCCCSCL